MTTKGFIWQTENKGMGGAHALIFPQQPNEICHSEPEHSGEESHKELKK